MKVLFVNCCISEHDSRTFCLAQAVLSKFTSTSKVELKVEDLTTKPIAPLNKLDLIFRDKLIQNHDFKNKMFDYANNFVSSDVIIIASPYWDLLFPAELRCYIEQIMVNNITFQYKNNSPIGLCKAKKLIYVTTVGGYTYNHDIGYDYIMAIANMLGIKSTTRISAEGLDIVGNDPSEIIDDVIYNMKI